MKTANTESMDTLSDSDLVDLCRQRNERAWETLVLRYKRLVYTVPVRAGLEEQDVEDVFQGTFVRLAEKIESIRESSRVRAWIVTTARNLTIDTIRAHEAARAARGPSGALALAADSAELVSDSVEQHQERAVVRMALQRLDTNSRRLLSLLFFRWDEKPSYQAISAELGMPVGSIGPTRARSLRKFRIEYEAIVAEHAERERWRSAVSPSPAGLAARAVA